MNLLELMQTRPWLEEDSPTNDTAGGLSGEEASLWHYLSRRTTLRGEIAIAGSTAAKAAGAIEILLADVRQEDDCGRVMAFFPRLLPDALVLWRGYYNPWIARSPVALEYLSSSLDLLVRRVGESMLFLWRGAAADDALQRAIAFDFTPAEQLALLERAMGRFPEGLRGALQLTHLLLRARTGDPQGARVELERLEAQTHGDYATIHIYLDEAEGWQQQAAGDHHRVLELSAALLARERTTHRLVMQGVALNALGRLAQAEEILREAIAIRPPSGYAYIELARGLTHQGRYEEAESQLLAGIHDREAVGGTTLRQFLEMLRMVWAPKNRPRQDLRTMARLLQEIGSEPEAWVLHAWTLLHAGQRESAADSLQSARELGLAPARYEALESQMGLAPDLSGTPRRPLPPAAEGVFPSREWQPWFTQRPRLPHRPVGMLGKSEAALCYYLARDIFRGKGAIIDGGSFLGRSAYYFAQGLLANPRYVRERDRIHCFDNFLVNENATVKFASVELDRTMKIGDSTRAIFEEQVASVRSLLEVHEGDFRSAPWTHQAIEILLVDIAKTRNLGQRLVELFFADLIPGRSIVIHQDYHHPWLPHIHVLMEYLSDYFELIVPRVDDSAAFLFQRPIPTEVLSRAIRWDFTHEEQVRLMDGAIARLHPEDRFYVELARIMLHCDRPDWKTLRREFDELEQRFRACPRDYSANPYFEDLRAELDRLEGRHQS